MPYLTIGSPCRASVCSLIIMAVVVRFKSIGSAPIMKNNVFKVTAGNKFQAVIVFLRNQLGLKQGDPLVRDVCCRRRHRWAELQLMFKPQFTYINAAFAPAPDDTVGNLFKVRPVSETFSFRSRLKSCYSALGPRDIFL